MSEEQSEKRTFPTIPYQNAELNALWNGIKDHFAEQGRVSSKEIAANADDYDCKYPEKTIRRDILPKLRKALADDDVIDVDYENPEGEQGPTRKIWVLDR